uniref:Homeobox domain-containing protein n=1 Tax=Rhabditophanes sp. KR3021 TaxID=114890 RepID=A0AC35TR78_9BILA
MDYQHFLHNYNYSLYQQQAQMLNPGLYNNLSTNDTFKPPYPTGAGTNHIRVRTAEKYRTVYSDLQKNKLEEAYRTHKIVSTTKKAELATQLSLTERQVKIWYQNRRAKERRDFKNFRSEYNSSG